MKKRIFSLFLIVFGFISIAYSANYYVAPTGSDSNPGTLTSPFLTVNKGIELAQAGDNIYLRGGTYNHPAIKIIKSGTASARINILAYQNEVPVLDFGSLPATGRGVMINGSYWYIKGLIIQHSPNHGLTVDKGTNITVEKCETRYNGDMGLNLTNGAANCLILNCDSYFNFDAVDSGENADGFAAKYSVGVGNVFKGCRAWHNSDDGWDLWEAGNSVRFEDCQAFENGDNFTNISGFAGDGNGYKLGKGSGRHILVRCVAWGNLLGNGFEDNGNVSGVEYINCTAYNNKGYNFETKSTATHFIKNNISYLSKGVNLNATSNATNNSWQGLTVAADDFLSLNDAVAKGPRNADGSLPVSNFLRLASSSDMIDKGVNVGLSFNGSAPDLGAYESTGTAPINYTLTTTVVGQGTITPNGGTFTSGTSVSLQAIPAVGWKFDGWSGAVTGTVNPVSLSMNSNKSVTATFSPVTTTKFTLTTSTVGLGTISLNPMGGSYDPNTIVTAIATPMLGWKFIGWSGAVNSTVNPVTITMDASKTLSALFAQIETPCTLVEYQLENGTWNTGTITETKNTGYTGGSYVNTNNAAGSWFQITVSVPTPGSHNMKLRYANIGPADRPVSVSVNGVAAISSLSLPTTNSWTSWAQKDFSLSLNSGTNTIRFTALTSGGAPNADRLDICVKLPLPARTIKSISSASDKEFSGQDIMVSQNYPNPVDNSTIIGVWLKNSSKVKIDLYNSIGNKITTIANEQFNAGYNEVQYNRNGLKSGVYIYVVETEKGSLRKQMILK